MSLKQHTIMIAAGFVLAIITSGCYDNKQSAVQKSAETPRLLIASQEELSLGGSIKMLKWNIDAQNVTEITTELTQYENGAIAGYEMTTYTWVNACKSTALTLLHVTESGAPFGRPESEIQSTHASFTNAPSHTSRALRSFCKTHDCFGTLYGATG